MNVLIISYFYSPCQAIGSFRASSWAELLPNHGIETTVITRSWTGSERNWSQMLATTFDSSILFKNGTKIIYTPYKEKWYKRNFFNRRYLWRLPLQTFLSFFNDIDDINVIDAFYEKAIEEISLNKYDFLIVSNGPLMLSKLAYLIHKKTKIPYIVDFRDLWNVDVFSDFPKYTLLEKIYHKNIILCLKRWLNDAYLITSINETVLSILFSHLKLSTNTLSISNGFERNLYDGITFVKKSQFQITILGTLDEKQDIDFIIDTFLEFISSHKNCLINFIGIEVNPNVSAKIKMKLPIENINCTARIDRVEALTFVKSSDVLFHSGWKGYRGIASGKLFEYLGSYKNILLLPSDNDIMEYIIKTTNSGFAANSLIEATTQLEKWYLEWENNGFVSYSGDKSKIDFYTRESQVEILVNYLQSALK